MQLSHRIALIILPVLLLASSFVLSHHAGPQWLWSNLDPDYWYLFDSLNMVNLQWPQHIAHPGTTTQWIGAIIIKTMHPFDATEHINRLVLANPEFYFLAISRVLIFINAIALGVVGVAGYLTFRDLTAALLVQTGPFLSQLIMKHSFHVSPEPLLITTMLVLAAVTLVALRPGQMDNHRTRYVIAFAVIAGFGMASKVSSAGMYLLPLFLLGNLRSIVLYGFYTVLFTVIFTLPAAGSYGEIFDWLGSIAIGSGYFGQGEQTIIDWSSYPGQLLKTTSRPVFFVVLLVSLGLLLATRKSDKCSPDTLPQARLALAGLCLALIVEALLVAKHPTGRYMIPALTSAALGMALIYHLSIGLTRAGSVTRNRVRIGFTIFLLVLAGAQVKTFMKLDRGFIERTSIAAGFDEAPFQSCARIYFWPASNPLYALYMGSWNTDGSLAETLDKLYMEKGVFFGTEDGKINRWTHTVSPDHLIQEYPCIMARGERALYIGEEAPFYDISLPDEVFSARLKRDICHPGEEVIFTWGIDCKGKMF
ncbi:MAG: hypothetical protein HOL37_00080 [Rhodospirillaceae bacterium]|jgi:hypothetical protein|nr:hypothetical protein [Rhodospirillaceae bacterium]MBT5307711.1 hypothetical protein [Rhodospirillaceae bacterium]MBT7356889.1 hypothetical protein [Rhodospirillaceae bacterium]